MVALVDRAKAFGVALTYSADTLPCFNLWKNTDLDDCHGYVTGLEPATNFAYNRAKERDAGRVKKLGPGEEVAFELEWSFLRSAADVSRARREIERVG